MLSNEKPVCCQDGTPSFSAPKHEAETAQTVQIKQTAPQPTAYAAMPQPPKQTFAFDRYDAIFALLFSVMGYCYVDWVVFCSAGQKSIGVFALLYAGVTTAYCLQKGKKICKRALASFAVLLWLGTSFFFAPNSGNAVASIRLLSLHVMAVYWAMAVCGQVSPVGSFLPLDGLRGVFVLPFANFFSHCKVLMAALRSGKTKVLAPILGGAALAGVGCFFVVPLLASADAAFARLVANVFAFQNNVALVNFIVTAIFSLPVAAYLYGLWFACMHQSKTAKIPVAAVQASAKKLRVLSLTTLGVAGAILCTVYTVFLVLQGQYVVGAFSGNLPVGFTYAGYARTGFFELCRVAAINLAAYSVLELFAKAHRAESRGVRIIGSLLCAVTLLLTATAAAKLWLYVAVYGFTLLRVLAGAALLWLMVMFVFLWARQGKVFSATQVAAAAAIVLVCLLSSVNWDKALPGRTELQPFSAEALALDEMQQNSYNVP